MSEQIDDRPALDADIRTVAANGIEIAYETFGDPGDPAILLVMGLGTQMLAWPDPLCARLADAGHHVIRFDNRDVGLSTHFDVAPPSLLRMLAGRGAPYRLDDMAADALGLLDALDIDAAHVVGASMGGFISQTLALAQPERVRSLTLIMTSTGSKWVGRPKPRIMRRLARQATPTTRDEAVEASVEAFRAIGSPAHFDEAIVRSKAERAYDRAHDPDGRLRQLAAVMAQPDRTARLRELRIPTLVVHGLADPLVQPSGGLALAATIPDATFLGFEGMGHDLPETLWPTIADRVIQLAAR